MTSLPPVMEYQNLVNLINNNYNLTLNHISGIVIHNVIKTPEAELLADLGVK